jgi:hypothetical protein
LRPHAGVDRSVDTGSTRGFTAKGHDHFGLFRPETGNEHVELDRRVVESRVGALIDNSHRCGGRVADRRAQEAAQSRAPQLAGDIFLNLSEENAVVVLC